ncbi:hypothetical protein [Photorhabdus bodei]|uniref:MarR family transcriptional regulator n=1 Tax=Photorhabdus bodei TaxID=2029681 RepID=A0AAW6BMP1_9GAMM|nr:hypothetical protein [Photorhabdus bodei]MDB6375014.1 hypothetical protein [Photorhabdus bodei]
MTFRDLEKIIIATARKSQAWTLISLLLDSFDNGQNCVDIDTIIAETGLNNANISAVTKRLKESGVLTILYKDMKKENGDFSEIRNGRWSKAYYKLSQSVLELYKRG